MATNQEDGSRKARPQIVTIDKAWKLAEQWVNNMTQWDEEDNSTQSKLEPRPPRLGVGAVVPRESNFFDSNDPVERNLRFKLDIGKKLFAKKADESRISAKDAVSHQESDADEDDEEPESKAQAFSKKRPPNFASSLKGNKKHK